jgi:hypothetical protein
MAKYVHDEEIKIECHHDDPTLEPSKKLCFGLIQDIKRKSNFYISDFTDSLNLQSVATMLYIYLVSLCSLVAFGGLLGEKTNNLMATMECILAGAACGALFSLFSGQPLNIISATGPVLILEGIIKSLCDQYFIDFMEFRLWIGIWTTILLIILVVFNLSFLVKYITRFTEDCFATLVAIVFIIDAIKNVFKMRTAKIPLKNVDKNINATLAPDEFDNLTIANFSNNKNENIQVYITGDKQNSVFYLSVLLFLATFFICTTLKGFRKKPYFPTKVTFNFKSF